MDIGTYYTLYNFVGLLHGSRRLHISPPYHFYLLLSIVPNKKGEDRKKSFMKKKKSGFDSCSVLLPRHLP